jgi:hypothetical protein
VGASLRPSEVFTPNQFPLEEHNVYVFRAEAERELSKATTRGEVPVVYGEFGVGKTTLIKKFFEDADHEGRLIHVLTPADKHLGDVAQQVLERIGYSVQITESTARSTSGQAALEAGFFGALKATFRGTREISQTASNEFVVKSPTEQRLLEVMADARIVLAIDEMHKASDSFRTQVAEVIKAASNLGQNFPQIVVLGTATDAGKLVEHDPGIDRLLREIRVHPMNDDEAGYMVAEGMRRLDLEISPTVANHIVRTAAGAPGSVAGNLPGSGRSRRVEGRGFGRTRRPSRGDESVSTARPDAPYYDVHQGSRNDWSTPLPDMHSARHGRMRRGLRNDGRIDRAHRPLRWRAGQCVGA